MLRINLLPPYVFDKQKKVKVWVIWGVVIAMTIGLYAYFNGVASDKVTAAQTENDEAHKQQKLHDDYVAQTGKVKDTIADTQKKQDFIANAVAWNNAWPALYTQVRDVTSPRVILKRMSLVDFKTINIAGWAPSEKEAADWWITFRNKYTGPNGPFATVYFDLPKNPYPPNADSAGGSGVPGGGGFSPGGRGAPLGSFKAGASSFGGGPIGAASGGDSSSSTDEEPGIGILEDRVGINFRAHVVLKTPFNGGKTTVPIWPEGTADTSGTAGISGPAGSPGGRGGPRFGPGGPGGPIGRGGPGGPPPPADTPDDSASTGKKGKKSGGEE